jgi:hypothetical protein
VTGCSGRHFILSLQKLHFLYAEADRDELKAKLDSSQEKAETRMAKFEEKTAADRKSN